MLINVPDTATHDQVYKVLHVLLANDVDIMRINRDITLPCSSVVIANYDTTLHKLRKASPGGRFDMLLNMYDETLPSTYVKLTGSCGPLNDVAKNPDFVIPLYKSNASIDSSGHLKLLYRKWSGGDAQVCTVSPKDFAVVTDEELAALPEHTIYTSRYNQSNAIIVKTSLAYVSGMLLEMPLRLEDPSNMRYDKNISPPDKDGNYWKPVAPRIVALREDYINEQIRVRYGFFDRPSSGLSNVVMDSYFPRLLYRQATAFDVVWQESPSTQFPSTAVAISPLVAEYLNVKQIPTEQLCRVLGYTLKDIKALVKAVKQKQCSVIFAGAGGTGINTAYWLRELCRMTSTYNIFRGIEVFEPDDVDYSNTLRFPLPMSAYQVTALDASKLSLIGPLVKPLSKTKVALHRRYLGTNVGYVNGCNVLAYDYSVHHPVTRDNTVIYGAPEIAYREDLAKIGPLVCATHADTTCSIVLNPKQDETLQIETYGMIQLGGFFMNQLKMAISFLELLNSDQDLTASNHKVMEFEFDGTLQLRPDRNYQWQIDKNLLVMTAEQANQNT